MPPPAPPDADEPLGKFRPDATCDYDSGPAPGPQVPNTPDNRFDHSGGETSTSGPRSRYVLGKEIARGGMGVVYQATDTVLSREVAVKVLRDGFGPASAAARRFSDEARIAALLQHPGIPPVHDLDTLPDGRAFLAMKLIQGQTLDALLKARPDPAHDRGRFIAIFEAVCQALAFAHNRDVVHRDLKPANVMVGAFGEVQVMDWGLAKELAQVSAHPPLPGEPLPPPASSADPDRTTDHRSTEESTGDRTRAGEAMGTPSYMPPEQARGEVDRIGRRADVFALGGILAAILTGRPPYTGATAAEVLRKAMAGDLGGAFERLDGCGADPEMVAVCKRCLSPEPTERPADAGEVAGLVAAYRAGVEERLREAERQRAASEARTAEQRRKRRWQLVAAAVAALLLASAGAFAWWRDKLARDAKGEEDRRMLQAEREATVALAEVATLCDRGNQETDTPPRWRLTLTAARSAQRRAAAALDTGPVSEALLERFRDATARLELDEADCGTAELCEKWFERVLELSNRADDEGEFEAALIDLAARGDDIFARLGLPLLATPPESIARAVRAHRLRYPVTFLAAGLAPMTEVALRDKSNRSGTNLVTLSKLLLDAPGDFGARVRGAVEAGDRARLSQLLQGPDGRLATSRELLLLYFACEEPVAAGPPTHVKEALVDAAIQRNPTDVQALFMVALTTHSATFRQIGGQNAGKEPPKIPEYRARVLLACGAAVSLRPQSAELWSLYAKNLELEGLVARAIECYQRAIELDPGRGHDHFRLASLLAEVGRTAEAVDVYRTLVRKFPKLRATMSEDIRVTGARSAIQLASQHQNDPPLTVEQRGQLRREARGWLRDWLTDPVPSRVELARVRLDRAFAPVQGPFSLLFFPPEEARQWEDLWAEIRTTSGQDRATDTFRPVPPSSAPTPARARELAPVPRAARQSSRRSPAARASRFTSQSQA